MPVWMILLMLVTIVVWGCYLLYLIDRAGAFAGLVLGLTIAGLLIVNLGWRRIDFDQEVRCSLKGGELKRFDRSDLCVRPGTVIDLRPVQSIAKDRP